MNTSFLRAAGLVLPFLVAVSTSLAASGPPAGAARAQVRTHTAAAKAFAANSHLVETAQGVVVIDAQFLESEARQVKELIDQAKKPLLAVIVTHPHPDHYNGVALLTAGHPEVPVYATAATTAGIAATEAGKRAYWAPTYGADYPARTALPTRELKPGTPLRLGGLTFEVRDLGEGEARDETVLYVPELRALFVGDLVYVGLHPWLAEGRPAAWLAQLAAVQKAYPQVKTVYPGHGPAATPAALAQQAEYIRFVQKTVAAAGPAPLSAEAKAQVKAAVQKQYPGYGLDMLVDLNTDALAAVAKK